MFFESGEHPVTSMPPMDEQSTAITYAWVNECVSKTEYTIIMKIPILNDKFFFIRPHVRLIFFMIDMDWNCPERVNRNNPLEKRQLPPWPVSFSTSSSATPKAPSLSCISCNLQFSIIDEVD